MNYATWGAAIAIYSPSALCITFYPWLQINKHKHHPRPPSLWHVPQHNTQGRLRACHMLSHTPRPVFILTHVKCNLVSIFKNFFFKGFSLFASFVNCGGFFLSLIQKINSPLLCWLKQWHAYLPEVASTVNWLNLRIFNLYKNKQPLCGDEEATCWQVIFAWCKNIWEIIMLLEQMGEMATML